MIETTRPELVAYQKERLAKFVSEKGQIVFAGDSITELFCIEKVLRSRLSFWLTAELQE